MIRGPGCSKAPVVPRMLGGHGPVPFNLAGVTCCVGGKSVAAAGKRITMELFQIICDGITYEGHYKVAHGDVIVAYRDSTKSTPVGGSPQLSIAERLLGELVTADLRTRIKR